VLKGEDTWRWLGELKTAASTRGIPVMVIATVTDERKASMLGADATLEKPIERGALVDKLNDITRRRILVVEDEAPLRYSMKRILENDYYVMEAANGREALRTATALLPSLVVLDLGLPDIQGDEVLRQLRSNPATADVPVLIATSSNLSSAERKSLQDHAGSIMSKYDLNDQLLAAVAGAMAAPAVVPT
jgi:CheY-like chemotaxis protein